MIKDLKKPNNGVSPDADQSLNEIIQEVEADNSATSQQNPSTTFQSEMNNMMRERATLRVPDGNQESQIADLTKRLQEQILQQQLLHEQLSQQRLTGDTSLINRVFENMYKGFTNNSKFMLFVFVTYIVFEKFNIISILKIDNMNIFNSSATNQLIIKSILFSIVTVLLKIYV